MCPHTALPKNNLDKGSTRNLFPLILGSRSFFDIIQLGDSETARKKHREIAADEAGISRPKFKGGDMERRERGGGRLFYA